jgi:hypothetical protein
MGEEIMPVFTIAAIISGTATLAQVASLALTIGSMAYQRARTNKLKAEMDKRKQVNVAIDGEPFYLPVVYGKAKVSGGKVLHKLRDKYTHSSTTNGAQVFASGLSSSQSGSKNEFLFVQQAICYGEIDSVVDILVDDKSWDDTTLKYGQRIRVHRAGNVADAIATANGIPSTNTFTNTTYASMVFKLNREEYNYNGSPNVSFFVRGLKIRNITFNGTSYAVTTTRTYSNNPALVLFDYLTNPVYGKGLNTSFIDLASFYKAKLICDRLVPSTYAQDGRVNGRRPNVEQEDGSTTTSPALPKVQIKLYECNTVLDSERPLRDNIELILESMEEAELIWSGGKYSLKLDAPVNAAEETALVVMSLTEDDIIRGKMELEFPDSSTRYTQCVARFNNEFEDFVDDTVTWPPTFSSVYNKYLQEDSGTLLKTEVYLPCTSDPYHALAKAEQIVRTSRREMRAKFIVGKKGLLLEPGDIITVTDKSSGLSNELMKVESIRMNGDLTADIEARQYSYTTFAWNVPDNVPYISPKTEFFYGVTRPTNLSFVRDTSSNTLSIGKLTWSFPNDVAVDSYQVEYSTNNTTWLILSRTKTEFLEITTLPSNTYYFRVRSLSPNNILSGPTTIGPIVFSRVPNSPYNSSFQEELYYTNNTAGVKSRITLNWQVVTGDNEISILNYLVESKKSSSNTWVALGETYLPSFVVNDVEPNTSYDFRITSVSYLGDKSIPLVTTGITGLGLLTPPSQPTGLSVSSSSDGLSTLSWNLATDLDVLHGGAVSIRHSVLVGENASWDTAVDLVEELAGNTTSKTVPTLQGTYFIKFKDSGGRYSLTAATVINTFVDSNFNAVGQFPQAPTFSGIKTNLTVTSGVLISSVGTNLGVYQFASAIDLLEITSVRLTPKINANIFSRSDLFCNAVSVCNMPNVCGVSTVGSVRFFIQTSTNGTNYTDWEPFIAGTYRTRYIKIKAEFDCQDSNFFFEIYELGLEIDAKDKIFKGKVTTSSSASTTVTFPNNGFYGGLAGTTSPTIGLQIINAQEGDTPIITSRTKTSFAFSVWKSGARVAREVDWQAIGQ